MWREARAACPRQGAEIDVAAKHARVVSADEARRMHGGRELRTTRTSAQMSVRDRPRAERLLGLMWRRSRARCGARRDAVTARPRSSLLRVERLARPKSGP